MALYVGISAAAGLVAAHIVQPDDSAASSADQPIGRHVETPPGWQSDPAKRGRISDLVVGAQTLFAVGPGLGVYRLDEHAHWNSFNFGIDATLDTAAIHIGAGGLYMADADGRLFRWVGRNWQELSLPIPGRIQRLSSFNQKLLALTDRVQEIDPQTLTAKTVENAWLPLGGNEHASLWLHRGGSVCFVEGDGEAGPDFEPIEPGFYRWPKNGTPTCDRPGETISDAKWLGGPTGKFLLLLDDIGAIIADAHTAVDRSWRVFRDGLPFAHWTAIESSNESLYVGTDGFGVFSYAPEEGRFHPLNDGLLPPVAREVHDSK